LFDFVLKQVCEALFCSFSQLGLGQRANLICMVLLWKRFAKHFSFFCRTWLGAGYIKVKNEEGFNQKKTQKKGCWCSTRPLNFFFCLVPCPNPRQKPKASFGKGCQLFQSRTKQMKVAMFCLWKKNSTFFFLSQSSKTNNFYLRCFSFSTKRLSFSFPKLLVIGNSWNWYQNSWFFFLSKKI